MLIIFGKKISENKLVRYGLKEIFGIGLTYSKKICDYLNIPNKLRVSELTEIQKLEISKYIKKHYLVESKLKKQIQNNVETYISNNSIRGFRHRSKLPVRGQRTHSNAKTCRRVINY